ncbi:SigE family RNA polymerase sigma factor [Intrasporangium sp. YIM S08009]|uniref:SigE family RNA polymerase sigma factor n=1 Tax=Intrasporangium zincisolvens TaxID=3080018 RepID=UPI002B060AA3|nr:SigE family RNA polymerase sigma factor [Intrasporangium sp. YIM S08009]
MTPADQSFIAFADATSPRLLRAAWLTCGDHHLAEDLVQGALVAVYQRWDRLRTGDAAAYARRCIINAHIDATRRGRREVVTDVVPDRGSVEMLPPDTRWLLTALAALPLRERQCVVLRHYADVSEAEVADLLDISVGTVKSSASRGLTRLRALLAEGDPHVR